MSFVRHHCIRPGMHTNGRICVLGWGYQRRQKVQRRDIARSSKGMGVLQAVQYENLRPPGGVRTDESADDESRGNRDTTGASCGARTSPTTAGYGRFITPCSPDASAGGNGSATTTLSRTPTRLPRQTPRALGRQRGNGGQCSRDSRHAWGRSFYHGE